MTSPAPVTADRFSRAERLVHTAFALLMLACIVTAAILYNGALSIRVGHRHLVELIHVCCGLALPGPLLLGMASAAFRADVRRLDRFIPSDWRWLRSRSRRDGTIPIGKFNAGQKLNASLTLAAVLVLLGTGLVMYFPSLTRLTWRTGATLVHDWFALSVGLLVLGHVFFAARYRNGPPS